MPHHIRITSGSTEDLQRQLSAAEKSNNGQWAIQVECPRELFPIIEAHRRNSTATFIAYGWPHDQLTKQLPADYRNTTTPAPLKPTGSLDDIAAITCFYNPLGYKSLRRNYDIFREALNYPLYTLEILFGDQEPSIPDAIHLRSNAVLWHKERALNWLAGQLPEKFTKVAWLDCDLVWSNKDFLNEASAMLDSGKVAVQLFDQFTRLNRDGSIYQSRTGGAKYIEELGEPPDRLGDRNPGGAWAAHREIFSHMGGLYDRFMTGGGDTIFISALYGKEPIFLREHNKALQDDYFSWAKHISRYARGAVGYVVGEAVHHWHGDTANRQWNERIHYLEDFDPQTDVAIGINGLLQWSTNKPALRERLEGFFAKRLEDG